MWKIRQITEIIENVPPTGPGNRIKFVQNNKIGANCFVRCIDWYAERWVFLRLQLCITGLSSLGVPWHPQILADQLTLSQPRGADYAQQIILAPPDFQTFRRPCIKEMHWNYTWLQLYSWSFDAFSSNSYNAWHLLIRCRWQSFRYFQLKLSKNILCTLSAYQSMHHTKQLVEKLSDGAFPPENIPPHYGLCYTPDFFYRIP